MNFFKNKIAKSILILATTVILAILVLEGLLRLNGFKMMKMTTSPKPLLTADSTAGWRVDEGVFTVAFNDSNSYFVATVNRKGNRIGSRKETEAVDSTKLPKIQLYGCSCTFGFSVSDTSTQCVQLQKKLPSYAVVNEGVPGYGLGQMYLRLQQVVANGDTPKIAVFNYANFQEKRTALSQEWSSVISLLVDVSPSNKQSLKITLPYYEIQNNSLQLKYRSFQDLNHFCPLVHYSSVMLLCNLKYIQYMDEEKWNTFHKISQQTALEIMKYCKKHTITPIFADLSESEENSEIGDISKFLSNSGFYTLDYQICFDDTSYHLEVSKDRGHPNASAHAVYADKLYSFLLKKKLIAK